MNLTYATACHRHLTGGTKLLIAALISRVSLNSPGIVEKGTRGVVALISADNAPSSLDSCPQVVLIGAPLEDVTSAHDLSSDCQRAACGNEPAAGFDRRFEKLIST